jgi:transcriptional regulator of NAD metabolism
MSDKKILSNAPGANPQLENVIGKLLEVVDDAIRHDGYGDIHVEVKILKRKQKEVIIHYGRQYRFVVDIPASPVGLASAGKTMS